MSARLVAGAAIAGALLGLWISPGRAYAGEVEPATHEVKRERVTYAEPIGKRRAYVELNNGAAYKLKPCAFEDSRGCYWDAGEMGNGAGRSFVDIKGTAVYLTRRTVGSLS